MADIQKPDMAKQWANAGDKTPPADSRINSGWNSGDIPTNTDFNYIDSRQDQGIAYILQKGIPEWDGSTEYQENKSVVQYGGKVYKCVQTGANKQPNTNPDYWLNQAAVYSSPTITAFDGRGYPDKALIYFDGRDVVGDNAGGPLRFLKNSVATDNGVTVYAVSGGRLVREGWSVFGADIRWAGAKCDGTTDDTAAVQATVNAADRVYIPSGVCLVSVVTLRSGSYIFGDGAQSIIKQASSVSGSQGSLYANSGSASSFVSNITVENIQLLGQVSTLGFSEFTHLASLNGVKDVLFNRVWFTGFRGDGFYLGSGINGGDERHNKNVVLRDCIFDGVNNQNRNGVSIIDVDGLTIVSPRFRNCTAPAMPGCIDIEPDGHSFSIVKNIFIHDVETINCGGNVGHVCVFTRAAVNAGGGYPYNIVIDGVRMITPLASQGIAVCVITGIEHNETTEVNDIKIRNVSAIGGGTFPYDVRGCKKLLIEDSHFVGMTNTANLGYFGTGGANYDVTHRGNSYIRCGTGFGNSGVAVFDVRRLHSHDNIYKDCGTVSGSAGVGMNFNNGTSSYVWLSGETYLSTGTMSTAVGKESSHTFNPATNRFTLNNRGTLGNNFQAYITDDAGLTINVFDGLTSPDVFPMGVSVTVVNGASGIPSGYSQGVLRTERYTNTSGFTAWTTQYFTPRNTTAASQNELYWRKSDSADTGWTAWVKVTAS